MLTRRGVLQSGLSLSALAAFPGHARSDLSLGDGVLTTVSDGSLVLPGDFIFAPMPKDELAVVLQDFDVSQERLTPECNVALYRDGENVVLFDVGAGPDFVPTAGNVTASLDALGLAPEDVTHVVFTHAHPDHIWGLLDDFDEPLFYEATYMMGEAEWDYWWSPDTVNTIQAERVAMAVGARRRMEVIEGSVQLFGDGEEILPGISSVLSAGHTPGHMAFEVRNGSESAMIVGDAIGNHHVALRRPDWLSGSDQDPETAVKARKMLIDRIVSEQLPVIGFHLPDGGMGRIDQGPNGYKFISGDI
ncbi:MBL fold metallo-hydrolase [Roseobacter ponti]|uniref:MBL fold metallo-hydrolase n=1 Tax=Roseobacter ponti TaxID=1891787 RepID=A0A858STR1_9RHOB|nr:MBL fold metallo-hydrolase [Roseobacter ponti]QJF52339.1 MBL fold metallo-hydrolase [Roseobacter ponti]